MISSHRCDSLAAYLAGHLPRQFEPAEFIAAISETAEELRGDGPESHSYFIDAIRPFMKDLPQDPEAAQRVVKARAAEVLGRPDILTSFDKKRAIQVKIMESEAELRAAESEPYERIARQRGLEARLTELDRQRALWNQDFLSIEASAKQTIRDFWSKRELSPFEQSQVNNSFGTLQRCPILRGLADDELARIDASISHTQAALAALTSVVAAPEVKPEDTPEPEAVKLTRGRVKLPSNDEEGEEPT
jgi:hypothetical protein